MSQLFGRDDDPLFSPLVRRMGQQAVKAAVMRAIFCPTCTAVLDMRRAVLVTGKSRAGVACGPCWDATVGATAADLGVCVEDVVAAYVEAGVEVDDGRVLFGRKGK